MSEAGADADTISNFTLYALMVGMLLFGTANTVIMKKQDDFVTSTKEGAELVFAHPYF